MTCFCESIIYYDDGTFVGVCTTSGEQDLAERLCIAAVLCNNAVFVFIDIIST